MIRFKTEAIEKLLEERKPEILLSNYQHIQRTVAQGTGDIDAYLLSKICRDLACLPTDIVEYV
jgi:DNA-binding Xre family transcriptional regulator